MEAWVRFGIIALVLISFLRRIFKAKAQGTNPGSGPRPGQVQFPTPTMPGNTNRSVPQTLFRPVRGRKNDFRDIPPPPENPDLG